jgi:NTE family protein
MSYLIETEELRRFDWFRAMPEELLEALRQNLKHLVVPGGVLLFAEGEAADSVYLVLAGRFVAIKGEGDNERAVGYIGAGESIGEMSLISGRPRSAGVRALRDSEVLRLGVAEFEQLLRAQPETMLKLTQLSMRRLEAAIGTPHMPAPSAIALLPIGDADVLTGARAMQETLARFQRVELVDQARGKSLGLRELSELESSGGMLIYVADGADHTWRERCHRQSDIVLWVTKSENVPRALPMHLDPSKDHRLVLVHPGEIQAGRAALWLTALGLSAHHHARHADDWARIARLVSGRGVALVLSGGGARGFAHLGVIQALREAHLQIDQVAGTSIGAVIAAGVALEWSDLDMYAAYKRSFVDTNPLNDYTLPFVSLVAGRKATRLLKREFRDLAFEDTPLPFFCVSANLTRGRVHEHDRGPIWHGLRASIAIPGVLPPVFAGGQVLVDGGVIDNLPIDCMRPRHLGRIVGVDIAGEQALKTDVEEANLPAAWRMVFEHITGRAKRPSVLNILLRAGMVNSAASTLENRALSDLLINPPVSEIDLLDWQSFEQAIAIGYRHTQALLERWPFR